MKLCHLDILNVPVGMLRLYCYHTAFHIVHIVLLLFDGHGDDGHLDFGVNTF